MLQYPLGESTTQQLELIESLLGPIPSHMKSKQLISARTSELSAQSTLPALKTKLGSKMSEEALDFVQRTIRINPADRMTAQECVGHPLFKFISSSSARVSEVRPSAPSTTEDGHHEAIEEDIPLHYSSLISPGKNKARVKFEDDGEVLEDVVECMEVSPKKRCHRVKGGEC